MKHERLKTARAAVRKALLHHTDFFAEGSETEDAGGGARLPYRQRVQLRLAERVVCCCRHPGWHALAVACTHRAGGGTVGRRRRHDTCSAAAGLGACNCKLDTQP